jgi:hypothetical protein
MKIAIDGSEHTGRYRVDCECGVNWSGRGHEDRVLTWSPILPIAETIVHFKLTHEFTLMDLRFSDRFRAWLHTAWETLNKHDMTFAGTTPAQTARV